MASNPEPIRALTCFQLVAGPVPPLTRGITFRIGVTTGYRFFDGACRSYATRPAPLAIVFARSSLGFLWACLISSIVSCVIFIGFSGKRDEKTRLSPGLGSQRYRTADQVGSPSVWPMPPRHIGLR